MTEAEVVKELALAAARIVVLEAEARALKDEARRLRQRATEEFDYSETLLRMSGGNRTEPEIKVRLGEIMNAVLAETETVEKILAHVMRDSTMDKEE